MPYALLITAPQLKALQVKNTPLMVFDCSFDLSQPNAADEQFAQCRIAGAVQAHLDRNLSTHDTALQLNGGRHPLPQRERVAQWLSDVGFRNDMQAVVYDRQGGNFCGRLWWMLKWLGHDAVAMLDGGLPAWQDIGGALDTGPAQRQPATSVFAMNPPLRELKMQTQVAALLSHREAQTILDARAAPRYRGEVEPLDPVAGHIPGALNRPFTENFAPNGQFKPAQTLRQEFADLLQGRNPQTVVHQCGSGVSALGNLIAMEVAGYAPTALYAGSWSEWCNTANAPVATGSA